MPFIEFNTNGEWVPNPNLPKNKRDPERLNGAPTQIGIFSSLICSRFTQARFPFSS
jgi:hypothetical protein